MQITMQAQKITHGGLTISSHAYHPGQAYLVVQGDTDRAGLELYRDGAALVIDLPAGAIAVLSDDGGQISIHL